jgi:hypothetical protein
MLAFVMGMVISNQAPRPFATQPMGGFFNWEALS